MMTPQVAEGLQAEQEEAAAQIAAEIASATKIQAMQRGASLFVHQSIGL